MLLNKSVLDILDEKDYNAMDELPIAITRNYCHIINSISYKMKYVGVDLNCIVSPYLISVRQNENECVCISTYCNGIELIKTVLTDLILRFKETSYDVFLDCLKLNSFFIEMRKDFGDEKVTSNLENIAMCVMQNTHIENKNALYIMDMLESDDLRGYVYDLAYDVQDYCPSDTDKYINLEDFKDELENNKLGYKYFVKELNVELSDIKADVYYANSIVHEQLLGIFNVREVRKNYSAQRLATDFYSVVYDILKSTSECQTPREFNEQLQVEFLNRGISEPYDESLASFINSIQLKKLVRETKHLGVNLYNKLSEV